MKAVSLLSSGIDSPVATYIMGQQLDRILLLHAENQPYSDAKARETFIHLSHHLHKIIKKEISAYIIAHGPTLSYILQHCDKKYTCILCKRMLLRYAETLAKKHQASMIILGDSLGQVASQTLQNIKVIETAATLPIIRPLIGFDKEEIIKIAREIGTYELSIRSKGDCRAVPSVPSTQAQELKILQEEQQMNISELIDQAFTTLQLVPL